MTGGRGRRRPGSPLTAVGRHRRESAYGDEDGGGGGSRTRVHECRDGVSTSLAGAFSLAHRPRVGRVRIASPEKSQVRPVGTRPPDPSPLSDATVPAADSPGVTGRLTQAASARERSSAVMVFRQFNEATGPRLAAPTAIGPCRNRFAPTGATRRSLLLMIPPSAHGRPDAAHRRRPSEGRDGVHRARTATSTGHAQPQCGAHGRSGCGSTTAAGRTPAVSLRPSGPRADRGA